MMDEHVLGVIEKIRKGNRTKEMDTIDFMNRVDFVCDILEALLKENKKDKNVGN